MIRKVNLLLFLVIIIVGCNDTPMSEEAINYNSNGLGVFSITNLTDDKYPDNPDIGYRSNQYQSALFQDGQITKNGKNYDLIFYTNKKDSIILHNINLFELTPTIPEHLRKDEYLSYIALINQEWNRNQVQLDSTNFSSSLSNLSRIDLARNCLNSYLWEIILYEQNESVDLPYAHGWFDFPKEIYIDLFKNKTQIAFDKYQKPLEDWIDPESKPINSDLLRTILIPVNIEYQDLSNEMYPIEGARKKKFKEIIYPETFNTMIDLQTDSALFATFSPPGYYNKSDPRKTELGRIKTLKNIELHHTINKVNKDTLQELKFEFNDHYRTTYFVLGGVDLNSFPILSVKDANNGWKSSMGFGNHPFYEKYDEHLSCKSNTNPYYAYLTDEKNNWLDSHKIGIDGPIIHWDKLGNLHIWLLSFERHALVGHYQITLV